MAGAYREIRDRIATTVHGHESTIAQVSLSAARHVHLGGRQRLLVVGPSGTGKTTLAIAAGRAMDCPMAVWDVSGASETGWAGVDLAAVLAELYATCDGDLERLSRAVLVLDEVDKLAMGEASGVTRQHRRGQQVSLLGLVGGGAPIRFQEDGERGPSLTIYADNMMVMGRGASKVCRRTRSVGSCSLWLLDRIRVQVSSSRLSRPSQPAGTREGAPGCRRGVHSSGLGLRRHNLPDTRCGAIRGRCPREG